MAEAAFTEPTPSEGVPAYINFRVEGGDIIATVRSRGGNAASEIRMTLDEFDALTTDMRRMRQEIAR